MHDRTDDTLAELLAGARRFASDGARGPHRDRARRSELSTSQHPRTAVLGCSDSRVPPELVLDQGLGDLFTIRTAGHLPDAQAVASVEFALAHLGCELILVLGHERCGAVAAALGSPEEIAAQPGSLPRLLASVRAHLDPVEPARDAVARHVRGCLRDLQAASPLVAEAVAQGRVHLVGAVHDLSTGETRALEPDSADAAPFAAQLLDALGVEAPDLSAPASDAPAPEAPGSDA